MSGGTSKRYPAELRERAVRMVAERLDAAGIKPSTGAVGSSYDALAESVIGLYKTELIKPRRPWKGSTTSRSRPASGSTGSPPSVRVLRRPHARRGRGRSIRSPPDPQQPLVSQTRKSPDTPGFLCVCQATDLWVVELYSRAREVTCPKSWRSGLSQPRWTAETPPNVLPGPLSGSARREPSAATRDRPTAVSGNASPRCVTSRRRSWCRSRRDLCCYACGPGSTR